MASDCWDISAEDEANLSIDELCKRHLSSQQALYFSEDLYETSDYPSENDNEESIQRWEFDELREDMKSLKDELKEDMKSLQLSLVQLAKNFECQENLQSQEEECPNEPTIRTHIKDEEEEFEEELEEEEEEEDLEVRRWVDSTLPLDESTPDVLVKKEPLVKLYEQEEERIEVDFVVEFFPKEYLKIKRQRDIEFILKIQDKDRINEHSRDEEATSKRSKSYAIDRTLKGSSNYLLGNEPGTLKEHDPDTIPFDPGG